MCLYFRFSSSVGPRGGLVQIGCKALLEVVDCNFKRVDPKYFQL